MDDDDYYNYDDDDDDDNNDCDDVSIMIMISIVIITEYSRDLRYMETMMESMMKLPYDMFRQELLPYLIVQDIVNLDNACMNHKYRPQLLDKIDGMILLGDKDKSMKASLFKWLGMRRIYLINMNVLFKDYRSDEIFSSSMKTDYVDQFRSTQHVVMRGSIRDEMAIFIISHCSCVLSSISLLEHCESRFYSDRYPGVTDLSLQLIAEHCTGLQSLNLD